MDMTVLSASSSLARNGIAPFSTQFDRRQRKDMLSMTRRQKMKERSRGRVALVCSIGGRDVYQPFRPPSQEQRAGAVSVEERLEILRERRGLWHEYAVHIPALIRLGFAPSSIEEATALPGVEQNQIMVASQVRSSLQASGLDKAILDFFDSGGAGILYELRILSNEQRKSAAEFAVQRNIDVKDARDLARAMKDYSRRKNEEGWSAFSSSPGDSIAFACYRTSKEYSNDARESETILRKGLTFVESKAGKAKLLKALGEEVEEEHDVAESKDESEAQLSVVELNLGETAGLIMLAVAEPNPSSIEGAPYRGALGKGPFQIYSSETPWKSWLPIPAWEPVVTAAAPIALFFPNSKLLSTRKSRVQDPLLLLVDKGRLELEENSFYLITDQNGDDVSIQPGSVIIQFGRTPLAKVLTALKPPVPLPDIQAWD